ncbi:MAG: helix-turn-helix domain-containing protein [Clostridium sp.]|nr:helix-turn-helix domain-containing protein [Clostridium sp.]
MHIDYQNIGQRIRNERLNKKLTQEKLAERCNISVPHMSNIENSNTKVSLPVLIAIANALDCTADKLLCNSLSNNSAASSNIIDDILDGCDNKQKAIIMDTLFVLKESLMKNENKEK